MPEVPIRQPRRREVLRKVRRRLGDGLSQLRNRDPLAPYTPKHLSDRILRTRSAIEGERKLVRVIFCDLERFAFSATESTERSNFQKSTVFETPHRDPFKNPKTSWTFLKHQAPRTTTVSPLSTIR
jgi:hypothetical protein